MKIAFRQLCVTLCGRFGPNERGVVGYVKRIRAKYAAKWGVQMAEMNFQTGSSNGKYTDRKGKRYSICLTIQRLVLSVSAIWPRP